MFSRRKWPIIDEKIVSRRKWPIIDEKIVSRRHRPRLDGAATFGACDHGLVSFDAGLLSWVVDLTVRPHVVSTTPRQVLGVLLDTSRGLIEVFVLVSMLVFSESHTVLSH